MARARPLGWNEHVVDVVTVMSEEIPPRCINEWADPDEIPGLVEILCLDYPEMDAKQLLHIAMRKSRGTANPQVIRAEIDKQLAR